MHIQHSIRIVHCVSAQFHGVTQKLIIKVFLGLKMSILEVIQTKDRKKLINMGRVHSKKRKTSL